MENDIKGSAEASPEKFELTLRVLNNDILGFSLSSTSKRKNWAFIGVILMVVVSVTANELWPIVESLINK